MYLFNTVNKCIHIISAYFLAAASNKRMRLLASLYGIIKQIRLSFLPAGRARSARPAGPKITLPFPRLYNYIIQLYRSMEEVSLDLAIQEGRVPIVV